MIKTILIIIVSVAIFGLIIFVIVRNLMKRKLEDIINNQKKIQIILINFSYSSLSRSKILFEVSKLNPALAKTPISFL